MRVRAILLACSVLALVGCATTNLVYLKPESLHAYEDRWGARRLYFRELARDTWLFMATTERSDGRLMVLRISVPKQMKLDPANAVALIEDAAGRRVEHLAFLREGGTFGHIVSDTDFPDSSFDNANMTYTHRLVEAQFPVPSTETVAVQISGLILDGQQVESEKVSFVRQAGTFTRVITLQ